METYTETILRYVVEEMTIENDESRRAQLRINGIDPDDNWRLMWSFADEDDAERQFENEVIRHQKFCDDYRCEYFHKYRVRDIGETKYVERKVMF